MHRRVVDTVCFACLAFPFSVLASGFFDSLTVGFAGVGHVFASFISNRLKIVSMYNFWLRLISPFMWLTYRSITYSGKPRSLVSNPAWLTKQLNDMVGIFRWIRCNEQIVDYEQTQSGFSFPCVCVGISKDPIWSAGVYPAFMSIPLSFSKNRRDAYFSSQRQRFRRITWPRLWLIPGGQWIYTSTLTVPVSGRSIEEGCGDVSLL